MTKVLLVSVWTLVLLLAPIAAVGQAAADVSVAAAGKPPRLNILMIFADDWGRYAGCYADPARPSPNDVIKTPNVDRVARDGTLFRNAFVPSPSCTPCRSSMLTGRYFFNTGRAAILNGAVWDPSIPTYPHLLRDAAGYHIGETYKVWSPGTPNDGPFGAGKHAFENAGNLSNNYSEQVTKVVAAGDTIDAARKVLLGQVRGNFDAFLAARPAGQPWLYFFGTTTTHRTWVKGSGKALWGIDPDSLKGRLPNALPDVPEVREDVADYLGEAQAVDAYVGVLLKRLEESGELDRTLVVISGDHGMPGVPAGKCNLYDLGTRVPLVARVPGGTPGRTVDDLVNLMDLAPTFLDVAGVPAPSGIDGRSLWPVLTSTASGQVDPARTWVITGRERHVATAREGALPYPMRGLRTPDFLYIRNFAPDRWPMGSPGEPGVTTQQIANDTRATFADMDASPTRSWLIAHGDDPQWKWHYDYAFAKRPAEELYDLAADPEQTKNVANDPAYATRKGELSDRLIKTLTTHGDPRVTEGENCRFEHPPFTDAGVAKPAKRPRETAK